MGCAVGCPVSAKTLAGLHPYLHQRTGGVIGSLSRLIRAAAISAILDGSARITRRQPDTIRLDSYRHRLAAANQTEFRTMRNPSRRLQ